MKSVYGNFKMAKTLYLCEVTSWGTELISREALSAHLKLINDNLAIKYDKLMSGTEYLSIDHFFTLITTSEHLHGSLRYSVQQILF